MARGEIIIIAAIAEKNRVIGKDGKLPWYISEDLKRFKRLTTGYAVLMGRKTFESIVERLGKPLPERRSIVLTSKSFAHYPGVETYPSIESALAAISSEKKIFVVGGERVFKETLQMADALELTIVEGEYEGDAFFPEYEEIITKQFQIFNKEKKEGYRFESYKRK
ncbi:dihydrofolate reductase [candidate division KSB1 bacterium]|nr:dihydrofolate reductase [candidate division KSB1 bacterium]